MKVSQVFQIAIQLPTAIQNRLLAHKGTCLKKKEQERVKERAEGGGGGERRERGERREGKRKKREGRGEKEKKRYMPQSGIMETLLAQPSHITLEMLLIVQDDLIFTLLYQLHGQDNSKQNQAYMEMSTEEKLKESQFIL